MYRYLLPLSLVAFGLPVLAQTVPALPDDLHVVADRKPHVAEPAAPLSLQAALTLALQSNPELSAARNELQATEGAILQAGALPNPTIDMTVEDARRRESRESTFLLSQPLELGGKRSARQLAAERGRDAAQADLRGKEAEVRATVITAFFDVLAAQERFSLARESADLAQRAVNMTSRRVASGKVSPVEETRAKVAESGIRLELAQARSDLASARKRLAATWGNPLPRFERAEGQLDALPALPDPAALSRRLDSAPALLRARHELGRQQALAQLERSKRIPDVTVSLGVKRSEELGRNLAIVGVSIPLPLFDTNRGNVLESLRREDKARDEFAAAEIRIDYELAQAHEKLNVARQEAESLQKEIVPGAQSAYDAAVKGFEYGKFGFLDVLDAQRTLLQAKSRYLATLSEAHRAAADIDRILGEPLPGAQSSNP